MDDIELQKIYDKASKKSGWMKDGLRAVARAAYEDAAKVCDRYPINEPTRQIKGLGAMECAAAIRKLSVPTVSEPTD